MLYCNRIGVPEVTDVNKITASKKMYYLSLLIFFKQKSLSFNNLSAIYYQSLHWIIM